MVAAACWALSWVSRANCKRSCTQPTQKVWTSYPLSCRGKRQKNLVQLFFLVTVARFELRAQATNLLQRILTTLEVRLHGVHQMGSLLTSPQFLFLVRVTGTLIAALLTAGITEKRSYIRVTLLRQCLYSEILDQEPGGKHAVPAQGALAFPGGVYSAVVA